MKSQPLFILFFFLVSCAKIPVQTIDLTDALREEGERMHTLNIKLVNKIFQDKKLLINEVLEKEYIPAYLENFKNALPPTVDFKANFSKLVEAAYPEINSTRDSLINVTDDARNLIVEKLNTDYVVFSNAFAALESLLKSATKVTAEKEAIFQKLKGLTNDKIDEAAIERAVDRFITGAASVGEKASSFNDTINSLIK